MYRRAIKSQHDNVLSFRWSVNKYNAIEQPSLINVPFLPAFCRYILIILHTSELHKVTAIHNYCGRIIALT